jgi:hypothetical protein
MYEYNVSTAQKVYTFQGVIITRTRIDKNWQLKSFNGVVERGSKLLKENLDFGEKDQRARIARQSSRSKKSLVEAFCPQAS